MYAHLQAAQAKAQTQKCKRACFANADKNCFKKITNNQKKKYTDTRPDQHNRTLKLNITRHSAMLQSEDKQVTAVFQKRGFSG